MSTYLDRKSNLTNTSSVTYPKTSRVKIRSKQTQYIEPTGHLVLSVPYSADYELTMDILRYGANVEVLAPAHLRRRVEEQLRAAANRYQVTSA